MSSEATGTGPLATSTSDGQIGQERESKATSIKAEPCRDEGVPTPTPKKKSKKKKNAKKDKKRKKSKSSKTTTVASPREGLYPVAILLQFCVVSNCICPRMNFDWFVY